MRSNNRLPVYVAALGFWLIIVVFGSFVVIQADTRLVALALLAFTVTVATTNVFRYINWLGAVVSIFIYSLVQTSLNGANTSVLIPIGYFSIGALIASGLVSVITKELDGFNSKMDNNQKLIDELRLYDPITGLMRYPQALRLLKSEIVRSQRYQRNVCLFLVQIENNEESKNQQTAEDLEVIKRQMVGALMSSVRATDIPFGGNEYGAVLPETNLDGAKVVIDRLMNTLVNKVRVPASIGIAQFPEDGVTEIELSRAAEAALQLASKTRKPFVQYAQIRNATKSSSTG
jgi:diguanylate cyclase (GGDEF)-like protein